MNTKTFFFLLCRICYIIVTDSCIWREVKNACVKKRCQAITLNNITCNYIVLCFIYIPIYGVIRCGIFHLIHETLFIFPCLTHYINTVKLCYFDHRHLVHHVYNEVGCPNLVSLFVYKPQFVIPRFYPGPWSSRKRDFSWLCLVTTIVGHFMQIKFAIC